MSNPKFDLEERTARFGEDILKFVKRIPRDQVNMIIIKQLVRSGTSVGANYCEADCAETRKDFEHKTAISKKESKETKHWLRMLKQQLPSYSSEISPLSKKANELNLIFSSIIGKSKQNK